MRWWKMMAKRVWGVLGWAVLVSGTVIVATASLELGFHSFLVRGPAHTTSPCLSLPIDRPIDPLCVPIHLVSRSKLDLLVPPIFAALVVTAATIFVHTLDICN